MLIYRVDNIKNGLKLFLNTVHAICETIDSPRSLAVSLCLQYQEWTEYLTLPMHHSLYEDPRRFAEDYLVTEILRKCEDLPLGIDRPAVALNSFKESETHCRNTNSRLRSRPPVWFYQYRKNIAELLGPLDRDALDFIETRIGHGRGATVGVRGTGSSPSDKYDEELTLTSELISFSRSLMGEQWWEHQSKPRTVVNGNKFTSVPKSWKTDRGICIEPTLNIYVQRGIGAYIRKRLKKFGLNLNTQERNRKMAEQAYSRNYATIDLSAASDSLSTELILQFFHPDWVDLLGLPRSGSTLLPDGSWVELEKWSSMGNGYTFELETLVFYALCRTILPKGEIENCVVYGDDIIVPARYAPALIEALDYLGFKVNTSKSFLAGNFFESCGHDYFRGVNVRPFYLKRDNGSIPPSVQVANSLRLWCRRICLGIGCDLRFKHVWENLRRQTFHAWRRCGVPEHAGDVGFIMSYDEATTRKAKFGIEGHYYLSISARSKERRKGTLGVLLCAYARASSSSDNHVIVNGYSMSFLPEALFTRGREPKRGYLGRARTRWTLTSSWSRGLEWITW